MSSRFFLSWRYKIFFDYILLNNHRLSAVIFPSIQTRLYVSITILLQICTLYSSDLTIKFQSLIFSLVGVVVALILDYQNPDLAKYGGGTRFMIFMLETANTRFAGTTLSNERW